LLAMIEEAMATTSIIPETASVAVLPSPLQNTLERLAALRSPRPTAIVCIVALVGVLGVAEFARSRRATSTVPSTGAHQVASIVSATRHVFRLPASYLSAGSAQLVSDDGQVDDSSLWSLTFAKGVLLASQWRLGDGVILPDPAVSVGPRPKGENLHFDVVSLSAAHPDVLGVMTSRKSRVHVELRDLGHAGRTLVAGTTPALPLAPDEHRDVGLSAWTGTTLDLIVVDRSAAAPVMRVQVFSAESDFHDELLDVVVPKGPFSVADFSLLIGPVNSPTTDLMLVTRGFTSSSHTEVHVLLGPQAFQTFGEQSPVNLPENLPLTTMFLLGHEDGLAVLYAVDRAAGVLEVVQLG